MRNFDGKTGADFALQIIDDEVQSSEVILLTDIRIGYIRLKSAYLFYHFSLLFAYLPSFVGWRHKLELVSTAGV